MDFYRRLLTALPRRERYLVVLPLGLLTYQELCTVLGVYVVMCAQLDAWEAQVRSEARARGLAS